MFRLDCLLKDSLKDCWKEDRDEDDALKLEELFNDCVLPTMKAAWEFKEKALFNDEEGCNDAVWLIDGLLNWDLLKGMEDEMLDEFKGCERNDEEAEKDAWPELEEDAELLNAWNDEELINKKS